MKVIAFLLTSFFFISSSQAKFNFASEEMGKYSKHQLTWWGFKIYIAEVWTPKSQKPDLSEPINSTYKLPKEYQGREAHQYYSR